MEREEEPGRSKLLERGEQLSALTDLVAATRRGSGSVALIEGPPGIGKSALLRGCAVAARSQNVRVLTVAGDEVVMESSFAATRELLWPALPAPTVDRLHGAAALAAPVFAADVSVPGDRDRASAVLHGLYWLVADLAADAPLALLVDDAHWLDVASARFLLYLARRIEALPLVLAVALRADEGPGEIRLGAELSGLATVVLPLRPLSREASQELVRDVLGPRADEELCGLCYEATRGNPFYLRELAGALKGEGRPTVELARRLETLGTGVVSGSVLLRLSRLGSDCERFAEALSILGPRSAPRHVAALADLDRERTTAAGDRLRAAGMMSAAPELEFEHPIVNQTIASQLPPGRRAAMHARAARLLADEGAPADRIAAHLLSADAYGEAWVVSALRRAAQEALVRGAPEAAVAYLRRAVAEPPSPEHRFELLLELGRAEALLSERQDFGSLREALTFAGTPRERALAAQQLALALFAVLRNSEAIAVIEDALEEADELEPGTVMRLTEVLVGGGIGDLAATPDLVARAQPYFQAAECGELRDSRMLSTLAQTAALTGMEIERTARLARACLQDERLLLDWLDEGYVGAVLALCTTDHLTEALQAVEAGFQEARRRGSTPMVLQLSVVGADSALRAGELAVAEVHSRTVFELARELGADRIGALFLPVVLLERGQVQAAVELVEPLDLSSLVNDFDAQLLANRGIVRIAAGEVENGLADVLTADRVTQAAGLVLSVYTTWLPSTASALQARGRRDEAVELAQRELDSAIAAGSSSRQGIALSVLGGLEPGPRGLAWLNDAVSLLQSTEARLEYARALVNLGDGLLIRGQRVTAREPLSAGRDLAHRCGGVALGERARISLLASGARPRREALSGPDALTAAERRAAQMAAEGMSNREIAQALFVSPKTVETQLSSAYEKLGIHSRHELRAAMKSGDINPGEQS
ncbi:MAG TPA: AAA family ATPase [Solirubrobacteraceae bacterium]|nr:AAA family ATPase [Solirubrobacteraceae bacterium]